MFKMTRSHDWMASIVGDVATSESVRYGNVVFCIQVGIDRCNLRMRYSKFTWTSFNPDSPLEKTTLSKLYEKSRSDLYYLRNKEADLISAFKVFRSNYALIVQYEGKFYKYLNEVFGAECGR